MLLMDIPLSFEDNRVVVTLVAEALVAHTRYYLVNLFFFNLNWWWIEIHHTKYFGRFENSSVIFSSFLLSAVATVDQRPLKKTQLLEQ